MEDAVEHASVIVAILLKRNVHQKKCRKFCPNGFEKDDNGCDTCRCAKRSETEMCEGSQEQVCRKLCPNPTCGKNECAMRNDNCYDITCHPKSTIQITPPQVSQEWCEGSQDQLCRMRCPNPSCGEDECAMRNDKCCDITCEPKFMIE